MNFSEALEALKAGKKVKRSNWIGNENIVLIDSDHGGQYLGCSIYFEEALLGSDSLLANDWEIVE